MAFIADLDIDKASPTSIKITDDSAWDTKVVADFTSRTITIVDYNGDTPDGLDEEIDFPLDEGFGDELVIGLPFDLAFRIELTYVAVAPSGSDTYTKTYRWNFMGLSEELLFARVAKSEIEKAIRPNVLSKYLETTFRLDRLIDAATYKTEADDLTGAQALIDKCTLIDIDTIEYNV